MMLFEGTYKMERSPGMFAGEGSYWRCTVIFDGLIVTCYARSSRRAFRKAHRGYEVACGN